MSSKPKKRAVLTTLSPAEATKAKAESTLPQPKKTDDRSNLSLNALKSLARQHNAKYCIKLGGKKEELAKRLHNVEKRLGKRKKKRAASAGQKTTLSALEKLEARVKAAASSGKSEAEVDQMLVGQAKWFGDKKPKKNPKLNKAMAKFKKVGYIDL